MTQTDCPFCPDQVVIIHWPGSDFDRRVVRVGRINEVGMVLTNIGWFDPGCLKSVPDEVVASWGDDWPFKWDDTEENNPDPLIGILGVGIYDRIKGTASRDGIDVQDWVRKLVWEETERLDRESRRKWKMWADGRDE